METLVVSHNRNRHQEYARNRGHYQAKSGSLESPPSGIFRGINCRSFHPHPLLDRTPKSCSTIPIINRTFSSSFSPKTPSSSVKDKGSLKKPEVIEKTSSMPIPILNELGNGYRSSYLDEQLHFSELWAGPAYSNSPPPTSLPIPKFSLRPKRTVSLDLPSSASKIDLHSMKSAPTSPTGIQFPSSGDLFRVSHSATKSLRRILNLDVADE